MKIGELRRVLNTIVEEDPEAEEGQILISIPGKGVTYEDIKDLPSSGGWYDFDIDVSEGVLPNALLYIKETAVMK